MAKSSTMSKSKRRGGSHDEHDVVNVPPVGRVLSVSGGGWLILKGLKHRSFFGAAMIALGVALVQRGVSGHCTMYEKMGINPLR